MLLLISALLFVFATGASPRNVSYDSRAFIVDGQRILLLSGSFHYSRAHHTEWETLLQAHKDGGINLIVCLLASLARFILLSL
jgi:hypothetical protein